MDMYLTADGQRLSIPLLPDRVNVKTGTTVSSFQTIKGAEYKIPRGKTLTGYSWNGVFPGLSMATASFVHDWQEPSRIASTLEQWMEEKRIIRFMLTETSINADVFIENFVYEYYGAGNMSYTINLSAYKPLIITTAPPQPEVVIPQEAQEPPISETKPPSSSAGDDKKKNNNNNNSKKDNEKTKLNVTIPTSAITDAFKKGVNALTSFASSLVDSLKKASTQTKKVTVTATGGGGSSINTRTTTNPKNYVSLN